MRILLSGMNGHMGREVIKLCENGTRGTEITAGVDVNVTGCECAPCYPSFAEAPADADCVIDFSHFSLTEPLLDFAVKNRLPLVLATTGQTDAQKDLIRQAAAKIPVFYAANYSLGVALLIELAKQTAQAFPDADIEIVEIHHNRKIDAPSGTALAIFEALKTVRAQAVKKLGRAGACKREKNEIGIHAVRMANVAGIHEVIVGTETQTITLKHEAHSRALFAEGALAAAQFLVTRGPGLYGMKDLIGADKTEA
jgi:4-hydroxy-tetrahydrodipicolinate reductase